jgi:replicative DNA helicase
MNVLASSQIYLDQTAETNPEQIYSKCRQFSLEHNGVDLIIVDYLQLMDSGSGRVESRQVEVSKISRRMKLLAKQLGVPIILLSQLSRAAEQRGEKPQLFDLRDSGAIEQDADIVMFLHKERNQPIEETYIELIVAKYRAGELRSHAFRWEGSTFTFTPVDPDILRHLKKEEDEPADVKSAIPQVAKVSDPSMPTDADAPADPGAFASPEAPQIDASQFSQDIFDNNGGTH